MQRPQELSTLLGKFHLASFVDRGPPGGRGPPPALREAGPQGRSKIRPAPKATRPGPYEPGVLLDLLWASPADVVPEDADGAVKFLELIRDSIDDEGRIVRPL